MIITINGFLATRKRVIDRYRHLNNLGYISKHTLADLINIFDEEFKTIDLLNKMT